MADRELRQAIEFRVHRRLEIDPQSVGETRSFAHNHEMSQLDLFDARRRNEKIVETLPLLLWIFDLPAQSLVYINALTCEFLGYPSTNSSSPPSVDQLMETKDVNILTAAVRRLVAGRNGDIVETDFRVRHLDGTLRWVSTRIAAFETDAAGSITRIIGGSTDITESRQAEERIGRLTQEASIARARERREIASLLHDSIGQLLPVANARLALIRDHTDEATREEIIDVQALIAEAHATASTLTSRLSPPTIHEIGLAAALYALARDILRQHRLKVDVEIEEVTIPLSEAMEYTLYRVIRELLVNVAKHSHASDASIRVRCSSAQLQIVVEDSGVGFEPAECNSKGLGLRSAQDRLDYLGARMDIHSRPGAGTRVVLCAPLLNENSTEPGGRK
jgi:PAS domain S-box-containing protein